MAGSGLRGSGLRLVEECLHQRREACDDLFRFRFGQHERGKQPDHVFHGDVDQEAGIARDEAKLADPDLYAKDPAQFDRLMKAIEKARDEKDEAEMRWLELAEQVEGMG